MTEQQPYEVLEEYPDFEPRRYPDHLVAEIEVGGAFELAGNRAFPRLARHHAAPGLRLVPATISRPGQTRPAGSKFA